MTEPCARAHRSGQTGPSRRDGLPARPTRLQDIADDTGLHVSTVSRVLTGAPGHTLTEETRERVFESARRLRYRPNALARGLRLAAAGALGMLVPSLRNPVLSTIIRAAFDRAWERGYVVLLVEDTEEGAVTTAAERLAGEGRIDGLLVASNRPGFAPPGTDVPLVYVNRRRRGSGRSVSMREEDAGRLAAEHLLELGHRRLAHIAGPQGLDTADRRCRGFRNAARAAGVEAPVRHAPFDEAGGFDALCGLLADGPPTAVFVSNINQAVGAFAAARQARLAVPRELSIVGYDDDPVGEYLDAALTTVSMPLGELGRTAVDALIAQIDGGAPKNLVIQTAPRLIERHSTARPKRKAR